MSGRVLASVCLLVFLALPAWAVPATVGQDVVEKAESEENLFTLAKEHGLAVEHLAFANRMVEPIELYVEPGSEVHIPKRRVPPERPPRDGIVINLPERGLYLYRDGRLKGFYPVAIGQPKHATPTGNFRILERVQKPTWYAPKWAEMKDEIVEPGPANPLGDRWMGLTSYGLGMHSTNHPVYVGAAVSHACIRLYPWMVHEVYDATFVGMPVRIEYEPVKVGRDPATGDLVVASFPDVYRKAPAQARARALVKRLGLQGLVGESDLAALVDLTGQTRTLVGEVRTVQVEDETLQLEAPVLRIGERLLAPAELARRMGHTVDLSPDGRQVILDDEKALPATRYGGRAYVAADALAEFLGRSVSWNPEERVLTLKS